MDDSLTKILLVLKCILNVDEIAILVGIVSGTCHVVRYELAVIQWDLQHFFK